MTTPELPTVSSENDDDQMESNTRNLAWKQIVKWQILYIVTGSINDISSKCIINTLYM